MAELKTARLLLRQWRETDRVPFAAMNADERVMACFPRAFTADESDAFIENNARRIAEGLWGNWAVELLANGEFAGFVGLSEPAPWHPCAGKVEIGWRLGSRYQGSGFATEAATSIMGVGFTAFGLDEIISYTALANIPSIAVMTKLGMQSDGIGFEHPRIEAGHPLRSHVVYRQTRRQWEYGDSLLR